jgi:hypothetical protein
MLKGAGPNNNIHTQSIKLNGQRGKPSQFPRNPANTQKNQNQQKSPLKEGGEAAKPSHRLQIFAKIRKKTASRLTISSESETITYTLARNSRPKDSIRPTAHMIQTIGHFVY